MGSSVHFKRVIVENAPISVPASLHGGKIDFRELFTFEPASRAPQTKVVGFD